MSKNRKALLSLAESTALAAGMQLVAHKSKWSAIALYHERNAMFWDVVAGLAIIVAAGGNVRFFGDSLDVPQDVHANNGRVLFKWR